MISLGSGVLSRAAIRHTSARASRSGVARSGMTTLTPSSSLPSGAQRWTVGGRAQLDGPKEAETTEGTPELHVLSQRDGLRPKPSSRTSWLTPAFAGTKERLAFNSTMIRAPAFATLNSVSIQQPSRVSPPNWPSKTPLARTSTGPTSPGKKPST